MKLTKEEWKQLSDRIFLTLRPTQHPVAMKFIKTPEEFDEIPGIEFCQNKASTCKLIGMAAHFQGHLRPHPRPLLRLLLRNEQRLHGSQPGVP